MDVEKEEEEWTLPSLVTSTAIDRPIDWVPELCWVRTTRFIISVAVVLSFALSHFFILLGRVRRRRGRGGRGLEREVTF